MEFYNFPVWILNFYTMADIITVEKQHPVSGKRVKCQVFLNNFGPGSDGYRFQGERVMYTKEELDALLPEEKPLA